jgi:tyrosine-specific transport protein
MPDKSYIYAISAIVGTSIGVGIFSLPYVASRSGFPLFLALVVVLGFVVIVLSLMYGEITLRTADKGRLVGYCGKYLGSKGKKMATLITLFSLYASMLAYIIIGGKFLNAIFSSYFGGSEFTYSVAMALLISMGIYISLKLVGVIELLMVISLFIAIIGVVSKGAFSVSVENLLTYDVSQSFFPFGAILFSLGALSAIPELEHIIKKKQERIKSVIISGSIVTITVYILFTAVVLGITGSNTSEEALSGLNLVMGNGFVTLGLVFGIFAIATSFLMIGINLKEIFWYDYHLGKKKAWALACFVPLLIFIFGLRDFITVVSVAGGIAGGFVGILIITVFYRAKKMGDLKPAYEIKVPKMLSAFMVFVFILGIVYQFVY